MKGSSVRKGRSLILALWVGVVGMDFLAHAVPTWAQDGDATAQVDYRYGEMLMGVAKQPPYIFPILLLCSVVTATLIIERFMFYRNATSNVTLIVNTIKRHSTLSEALTAIGPAPGVAGRVFRLALQSARDGYSPDQTEQLVQGEVTKELSGLEKFLPQLDTMITLCPLLGLAGTTMGMIRAFAVVHYQGMSNPSFLAGGISEALVNTATGLLIAIPALFAYNWFSSQKEQMLMEMEKGLSEVMVLLKSS